VSANVRTDGMARSAKARLRDRAEGLGVRSLRGKPLSRLNIKELNEAIWYATAPRQEVRDGGPVRFR